MIQRGIRHVPDAASVVRKWRRREKAEGDGESMFPTGFHTTGDDAGSVVYGNAK
jgi:hypothetical protein